jgi:predicted metal-dependent hydrolase
MNSAGLPASHACGSSVPRMSSAAAPARSRYTLFVNQLSLPLTPASSNTAHLRAGDAVITVRFVRNDRARRYVLRLQRDGVARDTVPRHGSVREAHAFVERQREWLWHQHLERLANPPLDGTRVPRRILVDGAWTAVELQSTGDALHIAIGDTRLTADAHAPGEAIRRWLRARATVQLPPRLHEIAATHGIAVRRVTVRDQRSRWGSCSASGRISLNWRLVQMPPDVRDYILVLELAHVRVPNHSRKFWNLVAEMDPHWREAERWLRRHGRELL